MRVSIQEEVLNSADEFKYLNHIILHFYLRRHRWDTQEQVPKHILESAWIKNNQHAYGTIDDLRKILSYDFYNKFHTKQISIMTNPRSESEMEFSPHDAANYLSRPAYVMVENSSSDGDFLDTMIEVFHRKDLKYAQDKGWWEYKHLGGSGEVEKQVEQLKKNLKGKLLRLVVIVDSDKLHAEHPGGAGQCKQYCENQGIDHWVLMKRKIENYLPLEQFPENLFQKKEDFLQAFKSLTREQRDFYELKKGFKRDENNNAIIPTDQQKLFSNLPQDTKNALCESFGKGKTTSEWFKTQRAHITKEAMITLCSPDGNPTIYGYTPDPDEIPKILDLIEVQL